MKDERMHFGGYDWLVLDVQDDKALLLSEELLFIKPFNDKCISNAWSLSSIRSYFGGFINSMYGREDLTRIVETDLETPANPWFGTKGCRDTHDRVFLLSLEEAVRYLGDSGDLASRRAWMPGDFVSQGRYVMEPAPGNGEFIHDEFDKARTAIHNFKHTIPPTAPWWWWLRSPGKDVPYSDEDEYTAIVTEDGMINVAGYTSCSEQGGVRPAMWLKL